MKEGGEKEKKKRGRNFLVWVSKFKSNLHGPTLQVVMLIP
jgi:hypothetical protein